MGRWRVQRSVCVRALRCGRAFVFPSPGSLSSNLPIDAVDLETIRRAQAKAHVAPPTVRAIHVRAVSTRASQ